MRTATTRKPHGPAPLPRRKLNPDFHRAVRASGHRIYVLATVAGLHSGPELSALLCAGEIRDTPVNVQRVERVADLVGFDKAQLFLDGEGR